MRRILVVDDDPAMLRVLCRRLEAEGFALRCAHSAEEAFKILEAETMDAILTDIQLPGISGFEAIGRFKSLSKAPILVITGHCDSEFRKDALALGAKALLEKPFDLNLLACAVSRAIFGADAGT